MGCWHYLCIKIVDFTLTQHIPRDPLLTNVVLEISESEHLETQWLLYCMWWFYNGKFIRESCVSEFAVRISDSLLREMN